MIYSRSVSDLVVVVTPSTRCQGSLHSMVAGHWALLPGPGCIWSSCTRLGSIHNPQSSARDCFIILRFIDPTLCIIRSVQSIVSIVPNFPDFSKISPRNIAFWISCRLIFSTLKISYFCVLWPLDPSRPKCWKSSILLFFLWEKWQKRKIMVRFVVH